jgi:hypothetical protein
MAERTEIKIGLSTNVDDAVGVLGLGKAENLEVWFLEADGQGSLTPLLDMRVVLRARIGKHTNASTVKIRPGDRAQLNGRWTKGFKVDTEDFKYKVEADWAGSRHVLAASATADFHTRHLIRALHGLTDPLDAFTASQRLFLEECVHPPAPLSNLVPLGPIQASRWSTSLDGVDGEVTAERWKVEGLDFMELSVRTESGADPAPVPQAFELAVHSAGLSFQDIQQPKTQIVLEAMVLARRRG